MNHWTYVRFTCVLFCTLVTTAPTVLAESIVQERQSGPVSITLSVDPKQPVIGDTVTLRIRVVAEQDVEVLMPDFGTALDRFSIVDFAPREMIDDQGKTVATQTYRLDPPSSGRHVIPPILIEYVDRREGQLQAPEGLDAYEVLTDRIPFEVASVLPKNAAADLKPPLGKLDRIEPSVESNWLWFVGIGVLLLSLTPFVVRAIANARRRQRRRSAYDVAKSRLNKILRAPRSNSEQVGRFYVGLSYIIRQYIEDRFEMRAPELTSEEFLTSIGESPDFSPEHQGLLRDFLKQADLVKFARVEPSGEETKRAIETADQFLEETRENAPMLSVDDAGVTDE